ncbi:Proton pump-interactor 1 [Quillaja saponaria]|uniref:Proton pump-interactor 1 n=1 Tax=Quillaja saponaria TaxID=32244 RepID=A0AAD7KZQ5_QUISA|nr:Proton pump-interactor 1 [Quillaja saponaria]
MTAELNVQGEVSEISKRAEPEVVEEDKCGLDKTDNYEDLSKVSAFCNGVSPEVEKEEVKMNDNCDRKDDADGSFIFVSGSNAVAAVPDDDHHHHEPADTDLNVGAADEKSCCGENVLTPENNVVQLEGLQAETIADVGEDKGNNSAEQRKSDLMPKVDEKIEVGSLEDSQVIVPKDAEWKSESPEPVDGMENDGGDNSIGLMRPVEEVEESKIEVTSSVEYKQDQLDCEKVFEGESKSDFVKGSQELNVIGIAGVDVQNDLAQEKELIEDASEIPLEVTQESLEEDSGRNLTDSCPVADIKLDTDCVQNDLAQEKELIEDASKIPLEVTQESLEEDSGRNLTDSCPVADIKLDTDCVQNDLAQEKELIEDASKIPLEVTQESLEEDSGRILTDSCPVADIKLDTDCVQNDLAKELIEDASEIPLEVTQETLEEDSGRNLTDSCPVADIKLDTDCVQNDLTDSCPVADIKLDTDCVQNDLAQEKELIEDASKIPLEVTQESLEEDSEVIQESLEEDSGRNLTDLCPVADLKLDTDCVQNDLAQEKELIEDASEIPLEVTQESLEEDSERNLTDLCPVADLKLDTDCVQNDLAQEKELIEDASEIPLEVTQESLEEDSERNLTDLCPVADLKLDTDCVQNDLAQEKELIEDASEIPLEVTQESLEEDSGRNLTDLCPVADLKLDTVIVNGPLSFEKRDFTDCVPDKDSGTVYANEHATEQYGASESTERDLVILDVNQNSTQENGASESIASLETIDTTQDACEQNRSAESIERESERVDTNQTSTKQNGSSESIEPVPVSLVDQNASSENGECFPLIANDDKTESLSILPACTVDDVSTGTQLGEQDTKITETQDPLSVDDKQFDTEHENGLLLENTKSNCEYATLEGTASTVEDNSHTFHTNAESGAELTYTQLDIDAGEDGGSPADPSVEEGSSLLACSVADVKLVPEVENLSGLSRINMPKNHNIIFGSIIRNGTAVNSESMPADRIAVENDGDLLTNSDGGHTEASQEADDIGGLHGNETLTPPKGSTEDILDEHEMGVEVGKMPFYYLIRLPRFEDESLSEQIEQAQIQVNEKTRGRDAINAEIHIKKAICEEYGQDIDAAISVERAARDMLKSKRQEVDAVQSVVGRLKDAISILDIGGRIQNMEHMIQHETLPLKEEKQLIREINQLKQRRQEISNNMRRQDEVQQSLDHKDNIDEHSKHLQSLRKEVDALRDNLLKAEAVTKAARKKYYEENDKLNILLARFKSANDIRQEAYAYLQGLRKQLKDKNKYFYNYKVDVRAAYEIASKGDKEELQKLCVNQVETVMELWNKNDEFRREYVKNNTRSTLRRLRTLDGRSLSPDEKPPIIRHAVNKRTVKCETVSDPSALEKKNEVVSLLADKVERKSVAKVVEQRNQITKSKRPAKSAPSGNRLVTVSGWDEIEDVGEEPKRTKEEEELAQKAEELRKEEEAAKLKEQRRLEEIAKAKQALERKKRIAEKAQLRATLRAQKDAEQKEKEKEKRARKKKRTKAASLETTDGKNEGEPAPSSEAITKTSEECNEKPIMTAKRPEKPSQFKKLTKAKSVPLPLRNRGKKKMQSWMWVLIITLVGVALFLLGNSSFSMRSGLKDFGF